jgi:hypothetical protein
MVVGLLHYLPALSIRVALMTGAGSVALLLLLVVYYQEAEILGLAFTPPTRGAGVVLFAFLLSAALVVVSNRLRKIYAASALLRATAGIGGLVVGLLLALVAVGGEGPWIAWPMLLLYLLLGGQACLALYSALTREVSETVTMTSSRLTRVIIGWSPLAVVTAQATTSDPHLQYVVGAGGGSLNILLSVIKGFLMYFGSAYLMTVGVAGLTTILSLDYKKTDAFTRQIYDAIVEKDFDAYLALCVTPEDIGFHGKPLMPSNTQEANGVTWQDRHQQRFDALLAALEEKGGAETLKWARPGQALGYLKDESEFVGNLYIEVTLGDELQKMVLEIGASQEAKPRGRLLLADAGVTLKTWEYYQANAL